MAAVRHLGFVWGIPGDSNTLQNLVVIDASFGYPRTLAVVSHYLAIYNCQNASKSIFKRQISNFFERWQNPDSHTSERLRVSGFGPAVKSKTGSSFSRHLGLQMREINLHENVYSTDV